MALVTLIAPTTSAVTSHTEVNTSYYESVALFAGNVGDNSLVLAGAEEVDIFLHGIALADSSGNVQKLTATIPMLNLQGGPRYTVKKDATVAAVGVYMHTNNRS